MPEKALLKKALSWFRVIVFASDIISDIFVIVDLFNHCLYHIAGFALLTFLSTGAFSGGFLILQMGQENFVSPAWLFRCNLSLYIDVNLF